MCTGKRQTHIRNAPSSRTAVTGIGPYNAYRHCIKNSELFQASREKSRKTKAVFLVASRRSGGKSLISNMRSRIVACIVDHKKECGFALGFRFSLLSAATSQALRASSP